MGVHMVDSIPLSRKKWEPKAWRIEYDRIVAYSASGNSNIEIAEKLGFTKEFVSVILNLPEGKKKYAQLQALVNGVIEEDIPTRLSKVAKKTVERLESMMNNDDLFEKNPFSVIDRGMDIIKGLGFIRGGGNGAEGGNNVSIHNQTTTIITATQKSELMDGLEKVAEVSRLHLIKKSS